MNGRTDAGEEAIAAEAAAWLARLRGPDGDRLADEHARWLERSADHRRAFARVSEIFVGAQVLRGSSLYSAAAVRRGRRRRATALGLGSLAATVALLAIGWNIVPRLGEFGSGATASQPRLALSARRGAIERYSLPGGSVVLDSGSQLEVRSDDSGQLRLAAGRARLKLTDNPRDTTIEVGPVAVALRGATVDVALSGNGRVMLAVVEGSALVSPRPGVGRFAAFRVGKGQWLDFAAGEFPRAASSAPRADVDWPSGWVQYRTVPLDRLVSAANRYASPPIVIDEPGLRELRLSGRFRIADPDRFVAQAAQLFDLDVVRERDAVHLRARK